MQNMDKSQRYYIEQKKSETKEYILYDSIIWNLTNKNLI